MLNGACVVYDGLDTNAGNDKNTNLGYIAIPIVLIIVAAILAAVLIPVLKKKKLNNRLARTRRTDLVWLKQKIELMITSESNMSFYLFYNF